MTTCRFCRSIYTIKYGIRKNKRGIFQKYRCKLCKKQFIDDDFLRMQARRKKFYKVPGEIKIMVFDILGGSLLLAVGILAIYFSVESKVQDTEFLVMFLLGFVAAIAGGWILITRLTIAVILTKLAGLILIIIGVFLTFEFPDIDQYQRAAMSKTGILLGLFLLIFGIYLFVFA